jgi:ubiquinone/menaquinone biosynthesis C-methylase UbiE
MAEAYLHGFFPEEQQRLLDQANFLAPKIYPRIDFSNCTNLLEIGSGVGAQTRELLRLWPELRITCVDYSESQIAQARKNLAYAGDRVSFFCQDVRDLKLEEQFDSLFICWALEHMPEPINVLKSAKKYLTKGAKIWATEVFNSSYYMYPDLPNQRNYYEAYNQHQISLGGDPDVGVQLGNLLKKAGFDSIEIHHGDFHLDQSKPEELRKMLGFWTELLKSGAPALLEAGLTTKKKIEEMERDFISVLNDENAVFFYQFVQAFATN